MKLLNLPWTAVEIVSSILPEKVFNGKVTRILGEADLQRNTLQVRSAFEARSKIKT